MLTSVHVKFTFDSERLGLFSSADILQIADVTLRVVFFLFLPCFYFGGARSKGFATLRNESKLQFFDKFGQAKSVGFRFYSAI